MSKIETGGPAFPCDPTTYTEAKGMTLRDYFATKAMPAIIEKFPHPEDDNFDRHFQLISVMAYAQADAMLEARE